MQVFICFYYLVLVFMVADAAEHSRRVTDAFDGVANFELASIDRNSYIVTFSTHGRNFMGTLTANEDLAVPSAQVSIGRSLESLDLADKVYVGTLVEDGVTSGHVRLSKLGNGKFHGLIRMDNGETLIIDPIEEHEEHVAHETKNKYAMVAYHLSDVTNPFFQERIRRLIPQQSRSRLSGCGGNQLEMAVGFAADAGYVRKYGGKDGALRQITSIVNSVDALFYDQFGVRLRIGAIRLYENPGGPSWNVAAQTRQSDSNAGCGVMANINNQLKAFRHWSGSDEAPLCGDRDCGVWHLMTNCGEDIRRYGDVAGVAFVGTICETSYGGFAAGVSIDTQTMKWSVVGHEIGHNFGAEHSSTGIMSYDPYAPQRFYEDSNNVCQKIRQNIGKCIRKYRPAIVTPVKTPMPTSTPAPVLTVISDEVNEPAIIQTISPTPVPVLSPIQKDIPTVAPVPTPAPITILSPSRTSGAVCSRKLSRKLSYQVEDIQNRDLGNGPCACMKSSMLPSSCRRLPGSRNLCFVSELCTIQGLVKLENSCNLKFRHRNIYELESFSAHWNIGEWSKCNATCGGIKTREITCIDSTSGEVVSEEHCPSTKPEGSEQAACNVHGCSKSTSEDDLCETIDHATCTITGGASATCKCLCDDGYFFNKGFGTCMASVLPTSSDDYFFVSATAGTKPSVCHKDESFQPLSLSQTPDKRLKADSISTGGALTGVSILLMIILAGLWFAKRERRAAADSTDHIADMSKLSTTTL